jgi:hypothetical protein
MRRGPLARLELSGSRNDVPNTEALRQQPRPTSLLGGQKAGLLTGFVDRLLQCNAGADYLTGDDVTVSQDKGVDRGSRTLVVHGHHGEAHG